MADGAELMRAEGCAAGYGRRAIVSDVSFSVHGGDVLGLLGANGSGKSTLLRALTGQIGLQEGDVTIGGVGLRRDPERAKRGFGYAVDGAELPLSLTGADYLELVASIRGCGARAWPSGDALAALGTRGWLTVPLGACSLGTRAKFSIAAALLGGPPLAIFDESLNGLDPVAAWQAKRLIAAFVESGERAVILSSHVLETVAQVCNRAVFLSAGTVSHEWDRGAFAAAQGRADGFEGAVMEALLAAPEDRPSRS